MDARQQQRAFNWLLARGYPTAAPIMFRALWLSAAKATKAVPVISVILFYFYKNAQGCQSGIHRIIDVGCLAVRKMQKNIVQTLKQRMTSNRGLTSRLLSYPEGSSVNDFIPREISSVQYATVQDAISIIKQTRLPVFMAKVDIESAFRIIPVSPVDRPLLGFQWKGKFYMDAVLPMGCASSCSIFESFSTSLEWVARHKLGATAVVHVIDDFLFLAHTYAKCELDLRNFINLCKEIGVPLAPDKTVAPCRVIEFLGITLDAERMEAR